MFTFSFYDVLVGCDEFDWWCQLACAIGITSLDDKFIGNSRDQLFKINGRLRCVNLLGKPKMYMISDFKNTLGNFYCSDVTEGILHSFNKLRKIK